MPAGGSIEINVLPQLALVRETNGEWGDLSVPYSSNSCKKTQIFFSWTHLACFLVTFCQTKVCVLHHLPKGRPMVSPKELNGEALRLTSEDMNETSWLISSLSVALVQVDIAALS